MYTSCNDIHLLVGFGTADRAQPSKYVWSLFRFVYNLCSVFMSEFGSLVVKFLITLVMQLGFVLI